jgi:hypothetical protein
MPLADRNSLVSINQEQFAGADMDAVAHMHATLHSKGMIHCDIKPLTAAKVQESTPYMRLI